MSPSGQRLVLSDKLFRNGSDLLVYDILEDLVNSENPRSLQLATRIYKNYMRKRIKHVKRSENGELQR